MEPALDVLNRALHGDAGARAFLERTSSIYVLDVTNPSDPKTYGCWNYIHQAMNETERLEAVRLNGAESDLIHHVRLLSTMALRVARRSPSSDRALVKTCLANSEKFDGTSDQAQWLIDLNLELREIVMGRIAATAFDFSFHRKLGAHGRSAFADVVVMDTFCAILSANAVSSGPGAIRHFAMEWIIPSSKNLPPFALASIVFHLASEGAKKSAPNGTKDLLQQLSAQVISTVLIPTLCDAVADDSSVLNPQSSQHEANAQVAAMCIRALTMWCSTTELSLPQVRHVCNKADISIVGVVNDALYSDSPKVVDSLADLMETLLVPTPERVSEDRMNQVRHIIQVDEESFRARFTPEQLSTIEQKEIESLVDELISAVGLQRFRFVERQKGGDHDVCRNLARISSSVGRACISRKLRPEPGLLDLLQKAAGHPSVNIAAIGLEVLVEAARNGFLSPEGFLPSLQRRAIIPHQISPNGMLSLSAYDICGASFHEFMSFREHLLVDALLLCWGANGLTYLDSCAAAVEEFCSEQPTSELSLQLEAAIFCIETVAASSLDLGVPCPYSDHFKRCVVALRSLPTVLASNPLTMSRFFLLLGKLSRWIDHEKAGCEAIDMCIAGCQHRGDSNMIVQHEIFHETGISTVSSACVAIGEICSMSSPQGLGDKALQALVDLWVVLTLARSPFTEVSVSDLEKLSHGIGHVFSPLPELNRTAAFQTMFAASLKHLDWVVDKARELNGSLVSSSVLPKLSARIEILAIMPRAFVTGSPPNGDQMVEGDSVSSGLQPTLAESMLRIVLGSRSSLEFVAEKCSMDEDVTSSLAVFLSSILPSPPFTAGNEGALSEIFGLARTVLRKGDSDVRLNSLFSFIDSFVLKFGRVIERACSNALAHSPEIASGDHCVMTLLQDFLFELLSTARPWLGGLWEGSNEQGQGQPAFESRPDRIRKQESVSNSSLSALLSVLSRCANTCPTFLFAFSMRPENDRPGDLLVRRAIEIASLTLNDSDHSLVSEAIDFLLHVNRSRLCINDEHRVIVFEAINRSLQRTVEGVFLVLCGKMGLALVSEASDLLYELLAQVPIEEAEIVTRYALDKRFFFLGNTSKILVATYLARIPRNELSRTELKSFLETIWDLHQIEDTDALPNSDAVARFVRKYR